MEGLSIEPRGMDHRDIYGNELAANCARYQASTCESAGSLWSIEIELEGLDAGRTGQSRMVRDDGSPATRQRPKLSA